MKLSVFLISLIAINSIFPAHAAEEKRKVTSYYVRNHSAETPAAPNIATRNTIVLNSIQNTAQPDLEPKNEPADAVWERYKALAAGQSEPAKVPEPAAPEIPAIEQPAPVQQAGLNGLLQQYQTTKAKRSKMNRLVVTPPQSINPASAGE